MVKDTMKEYNYFKIYDELIDGIPEGILIKDYSIGKRWSYVETKDNIGLAMNMSIDSIDYSYSGTLKGRVLKEVAKLSKSWNFVESSVGLAAINAYYNKMENLSKNKGNLKDDDAFVTYKDKVRNKKVSVIGHFPFLEKQLKDICDLYIIEKRPSKGDYPDSACEYLLPVSDYVFITSSTIVNKTFTRLIELAKNGETIMVGPSTPLTPKLFEYNIDNLSGFIVEDKENFKKSINGRIVRDFFQFGKMVNIKRK